MNYEEIIEIIKKFKLAVTSIAMVVLFFIGSYKIYTNLYTKIDENIKQTEITQISLSKAAKREYENNPCSTSRNEWSDYIMLHSQYQKLMKKHNPLLEEMSILPMEKLAKDSCKCYNGKGDCDE